MKILYIAPRYHTNQVPVMHGWKADGKEVVFWAQFCGVTEVHDDVQFYQMEQSKLSKLICKRIEKKYPEDVAETKKILAFIPSKRDMFNKLVDLRPDVIIMRERTICNAVIYRWCKKLGYRNCILYVQTPIYGNAKKENLLKSMLKKRIFPQTVFSPIWYKGRIRGKDNYLGGDVKHFVPLVCDKPMKKEKEYCKCGRVHILDVGKYRDYKNHEGLVEAIRLIEDKSKLIVTIAGQATTEPEEQYYSRLQKKINEYGLHEIIKLKKNIPFNEMNQLYSANDILILPSKGESAGMVILEAMSQGLCVMSSIYCGLASVLDEYKCGFTFDIKNPKTLTLQLERVIADPSVIEKMGKKSVDIICQNFLFSNYKSAILTLMNDAIKGE